MRKSLRIMALTVGLMAGLVTANSAAAQVQAYVPGTIRPSASQAVQDAALLKYWNFWKTNFLSTKCSSGTFAVLSKDADGWGLLGWPMQ